MGEEFDAVTAGLGGHGGLGSGSGSGPGHTRPTSYSNDYDERMLELKRHIRYMQENFKRKELRRKKGDQEKAEKWIQYKADQRKQRDDENDQRRLREQKSREHRQQPQPILRTHTSSVHMSGNAGGEEGGHTRTKSVVVVVSKEEDEDDAEKGTARSSLLLPQIAESRESIKGKEAVVAKRKNDKKATVPKQNKKENPMFATPARVVREKSVMQQAQEEFQGLYKSADGVAILKMGSKRHQAHREALVRLDQKLVDETKLEIGEEHAEEEQQNEVQEQPTISNKHMARKYRLQMMQQLTSQVLQCRRKMASKSAQMSILSPHELDLT